LVFVSVSKCFDSKKTDNMLKRTTTIRSTSRRRAPSRGGAVNRPEAKGVGFDAQHEHAVTVARSMVTKKKEQPVSVEDSTESWARCVRELLHRHDVSSRKYGRVVGEILGMEYMAGYRRAWGKHPWRLDEIEKIARHFGETAAQVLEPLLTQPAEPAVLMVGSLKVKCAAVLGKQLSPPFKDQLVAIGGLETWLIVPSADVALPAREVRKIVFSCSTPAPDLASTQEPPDDDNR
jgi:hypothetical protein